MSFPAGAADVLSASRTDAEVFQMKAHAALAAEVSLREQGVPAHIAAEGDFAAGNKFDDVWSKIAALDPLATPGVQPALRHKKAMPVNNTSGPRPASAH